MEQQIKANKKVTQVVGRLHILYHMIVVIIGFSSWLMVLFFF